MEFVTAGNKSVSVGLDPIVLWGTECKKQEQKKTEKQPQNDVGEDFPKENSSSAVTSKWLRQVSVPSVLVPCGPLIFNSLICFIFSPTSSLKDLKGFIVKDSSQ